MIKIAICDDDESSVTRLAEIVEQYTRRNNLPIEVNTFSSGVALLEKFNGYDLIFLDIDMPEMNGIDVAKKLRDSYVIAKIVYVTNHAHFTSQALSIHAFAYIVKPFEDSEIFSLLEDFMKFFNAETQLKCKKISFKTAQGVVCLNIEDIIYFEYSREDGVKIVTKREVSYIRLTLKEIWGIVEKYDFATPHRSFIVNLLYVRSYDDSDIFMENGDIVPIAQKRVSSFKTTHNRFMRGS